MLHFMNNNFFSFRKARQWIVAISAFMLVFAACKDDDDTKNKAVHDPNRPVELVSFKPDSGRISEMVLLDGSNFGSDTSKVKVFFNSKEAVVLGSTGTRLLALVPRLPGDTCIVSVEVDGRKYAYNDKFRYKIEASVTTIAGDGMNSTAALLDLSSLDKARIQPTYIGIDKDFNIFTLIRTSDAKSRLLKLNVDENSITVLATSENHGVDFHGPPVAHPETGLILLGSGGDGIGNGQRDRFSTLDPKEGWAPKNHYIKRWITNEFTIPTTGAAISGLASESHYTLLYCAADGFYYTRYLSGQIVRINPATWEAEVIFQSNSGIAWGLAFHSINKSELWFAYDNGQGAELSNSLCRLDVTDPVGTFEKMSGATNGGHRDGPLDQAQFYGIRMINFDADGNLFVGENNNHCIRKVDTQTMMVETLIGIPGKSGFLDGKKEDAQFNGPHGLVVDSEGVIFVADYSNCRIRRIAIE
jgi:hypothetical protein